MAERREPGCQEPAGSKQAATCGWAHIPK